MNKLISRKEAAAYLGISPGTLSNWNSSGSRKITYIKIGRRVKYRTDDLDAFIEAGVVDGGDNEGAENEQG